MSMTINAAAKMLNSQPDNENIGEVSKAVASAMLRGARGNSGVILSLLFRGIAKGFEGKAEATTEDIANALKYGVEAAYDAVAKPTDVLILRALRILFHWSVVNIPCITLLFTNFAYNFFASSLLVKEYFDFLPADASSIIFDKNVIISRFNFSALNHLATVLMSTDLRASFTN